MASGRESSHCNSNGRAHNLIVKAHTAFERESPHCTRMSVRGDWETGGGGKSHSWGSRGTIACDSDRLPAGMSDGRGSGGSSCRPRLWKVGGKPPSPCDGSFRCFSAVWNPICLRKEEFKFM